jgi:light-regulated signal transduction histidine kinase (bacteriophytochrome)
MPILLIPKEFPGYGIVKKDRHIGIWLYSADDGSTIWDEAARAVFRIASTSTLSRREIFSQIHPDDRDAAKFFWQRCLTDGTAYSIQFRLCAPDGSVHTVEERAALLPVDDGRRQIVGTVEERAPGTGRRSDAPETASEAPDAAAFADSSLLHDLRAPLRHVLGFSRMLGETADGEPPLSAERRRVLNIVIQAGERLNAFLDGIGRWAAIGRVPLSLATVDLNTIAEEWQDALRRRDKHPLPDLRMTPLPPVRGDKALLTTALEQLLENARIFQRPDAEPIIEFSATSEDEGSATFRLSDNGVGFNMRYADKLFRPLQRLHHVQEFPGIGIGLAISRKIIEAHGGSIRMQSSPDAGTQVFFTLPLFDAQLDRTAHSPTAALAENDHLQTQLRRQQSLLAQSIAELDAFSYSVAHDLRAPLRAIAGFSEVLRREHSAGLSADALQLLHRMNTSATQMGLLIDGLLQLSRIKRSELTTEDIDMTLLAREIADELRRVPQNARLQVSISALPAARGDRLMIRQLLSQLIGNAVKFSRREEAPQVRIFSETHNGQTVYSVSDNGAGFDMKYAKKIFGVFERLHRQEDFEGVGIGLAIADCIVRRHQGTIAIDSEVRQGTTISFTLSVSDKHS